MATGASSARASATPLRSRRRVDRMTPGQLRILRAAFSAMMGIADDRGYTFFAGIHGLPLPIGCDNAHGTPFFLPWHRAYLFFFERALRDQGPDAMLTWWDWTARPEAVPAAFADEEADGEPNPLLTAPVDPLALEQARAAGLEIGEHTERAPGAAQLPTAAEVRTALNIRQFTRFSAAVEELHNRVHVWVGGHMSQVPFAAFDPIFWAHHTMIDRLWRIWQLRHPGANPPATILDEALPPFRMTVRQTLDVTVLGYDYAVSTTSATVTQ